MHGDEISASGFTGVSTSLSFTVVGVSGVLVLFMFSRGMQKNATIQRVVRIHFPVWRFARHLWANLRTEATLKRHLVSFLLFGGLAFWTLEPFGFKRSPGLKSPKHPSRGARFWWKRASDAGYFAGRLIFLASACPRLSWPSARAVPALASPFNSSV